MNYSCGKDAILLGSRHVFPFNTNFSIDNLNPFLASFSIRKSKDCTENSNRKSSILTKFDVRPMTR